MDRLQVLWTDTVVMSEWQPSKLELSTVCAGDVGGGHVWGSGAPSWDLPWLPFFRYFPFVWSSGSGHVFQVVLATGPAGEEGPLLLELSPGKVS